MNINNIKKLLSAYFLENGRHDLIQIFVMITVITYLTSVMSGMQIKIALVIALFMILMNASRLFWHLGRSSANIHYLMLPANSSEKVMANLLIANIAYVAEAALAVLIGATLAFISYKVYFHVNDLQFSSIFSEIKFGKCLVILYTSIALFFFGSVYFAKRAFGKTILTIIAFFFAMSIVGFVTMWLNFKLTVPDFQGVMNVNFSLPSSSSAGSSWLSFILFILVIGTCYWASYIRLRETEA